MTERETTDKFISLWIRWSGEVAHESSTTERVEHKVFREIVAMGRPAIPLIVLANLIDPCEFSHALYEITGENPVPAELRGRRGDMARAWAKWAVERGHVTEDEVAEALGNKDGEP